MVCMVWCGVMWSGLLLLDVTKAFCALCSVLCLVLHQERLSFAFAFTPRNLELEIDSSSDYHPLSASYLNVLYSRRHRMRHMAGEKGHSRTI